MSCNAKSALPAKTAKTTHINNSLIEIENIRVPVLLIGLSERILLQGNRKLKTVTAIILIRHLIFEIVLIKGNASEKEMKEKQRNLKMVMRSKLPARCLQIIQLFVPYVGSSSVQLKDLTVQI